jgi:hypothetical protein
MYVDSVSCRVRKSNISYPSGIPNGINGGKSRGGEVQGQEIDSI